MSLTLKTGFITDEFSSLSGLAAVAYGDVDYFRDVQNQIYATSPTKFADFQRPSDAFADFLLNKSAFFEFVLGLLEAEYESNDDFADYIDVNVGPFWRSFIQVNIEYLFLGSFDKISTYGGTLSGYTEMVLRQLFMSKETISQKSITSPLSTIIFETTTPPKAKILGTPVLKTSAVGEIAELPDVNEILAQVVKNVTNAIKNDKLWGTDVDAIFNIVSYNPQTKISVPPKNAVVPLEGSVDLGKDFRGLDFVNAYLTPGDYYNNIPYPGLTSPLELPRNFRDSIIQGYAGYPSSTPLEVVFNPQGAESVRDINLSSPVTSVLSNGSVLGELPNLSEFDRNVYEISLIGPKMNNYLSFDPTTMSNGDLINTSLVPQFETNNSDPDRGLVPAARTFSRAF